MSLFWLVDVLVLVVLVVVDVLVLVVLVVVDVLVLVVLVVLLMSLFCYKPRNLTACLSLERSVF
jgi:hypothetical protein